MCVNGKMRPVETICIKENDGGGKFQYDILSEVL
jgi:hypothetical protein